MHTTTVKPRIEGVQALLTFRVRAMLS